MLTARPRSSLLALPLALFAVAVPACQHGATGVATGSDAAGQALAPGGPALTVLTFNIWHDQRDWPARLDYILRALPPVGADVIGLQEVLQRETLPNQAATLAAALGYEFHFSTTDPEERAHRYGNAILTRHPVLARNWVALEPRDDFRTAAHVRIAWHGLEVDIYNTHLHHTAGGAAIRRRQVESLLAFIESTRGSGPLVVMGDFNALADSPELQDMRSEFVDAYAAVHADPAARARTTLNTRLGHTPRRIDHIFVERDGTDVLDSAIILDEPYADSAWASDHFGVVARLRFRERPPQAR